MNKKTIIIIVIALLIIAAAAYYFVRQKRKKERQQEIESKRRGKMNYYKSFVDLGTMYMYAKDPEAYNELAGHLSLPAYESAMSSEYFDAKENLDLAVRRTKHFIAQAINYKVTLPEQLQNEVNYSLWQAGLITKDEAQNLYIRETASFPMDILSTLNQLEEATE
jgi:hypothetical protein